jgi:hypothetical protein
MKAKGVVHIIINGKQMDTARFLYSLESDEKQDIYNSLEETLDRFLNWLADFNNQAPIKYVQFCSTDFACDNDCKTSMAEKFSVLGVLLEKKKIEQIMSKLGDRHMTRIEFEKNA